MDRFGVDPLEQTPEQEEMTRLCDTVSRELVAGRLLVAAEAAMLLVKKHPQSTTAHEMMGDVLLAQGKRQQARDEYKQAIEIEPANADAERKFAQAMLAVEEADYTRRLMQTGDFTRLRGAMNQDVSGATYRAAVFPGLGHLYTGAYEVGMILAALGLVFLGLAIWGVGEYIFSLSPRGDEMGVGEIVAAIMGGLGYVALIGWGVWDIQRSQSKNASSPQDHRPST